jgi:ubiquinone biosynthesis protein UbiJ
VAKTSNAVSDVLAEIDALNKRLDRLEQQRDESRPTIREARP